MIDVAQLANSLRAEVAKLLTTKAVWWTSATFLVLVFFSSQVIAHGLSVVMDADFFLLEPMGLLYVAPMVGYPVLGIQAIMVVTTEYRYRMQTATYLAVPQRWIVVVSKLVVYGLFAVALAFGSGFVSLLVARLRAANPELVYSMGDSSVWQALGLFCLGAFGMVVFSQAIGLLVRHTAGAVGIVLAWKFAAEEIVGFFPKYGPQVREWLPFQHLSNFVNGGGFMESWSTASSAGYFFVWAVVLWALGLAALYARDA
ncbi:hypothetical protein CATYP_09245 [Corynebacterium atypicum]|uniref:ABC transporter permease n=1 Tax=Corynebacterium atypicum TaxID=191610 RepID=A0ABM5QPH0_9CORY|nr:hypothetical protein CATYP_09245 [Corynebacterium atypicum]